MKKLLSILLLVTLSFGVISATAFAETEIKGLEENLDELLMRNYFTQEELAEMEKEYMEFYSEFAYSTIIPRRQEMQKMETESVEEEHELIMELVKINIQNGLRVSYFSNGVYSAQYAQSGCFGYLFSEIEYWRAPLVRNGNGDSRTCYRINGERFEDINEYFAGYDVRLIGQYKALKLIEDKNKIKGLLLEKGENQVEEVKFSSILSTTSLYIRCPEQEYLLKLYDNKWDSYKKIDDTYYEFMTIGEFAQECEEYRYDGSKTYVTPIKPTFETEAKSLQVNGLLKGNENGLDLLKPLTRIEAVTMLLRALGESTSTEATAQTFADVPASHWGYGAAENAYSLGLIKGVGNDMFAPDDMVTGPQFATMVLRAINHADFNWEEALDILINEGVISAEDALTMDFFTRGDMAKIIYESIEKGLF